LIHAIWRFCDKDFKKQDDVRPKPTHHGKFTATENYSQLYWNSEEQMKRKLEGTFSSLFLINIVQNIKEKWATAITELGDLDSEEKQQKFKRMKMEQKKDLLDLSQLQITRKSIEMQRKRITKSIEENEKEAESLQIERRKSRVKSLTTQYCMQLMKQEEWHGKSPEDLVKEATEKARKQVKEEEDKEKQELEIRLLTEKQLVIY
jgi:hypothetical protein